MAHDRSLVNGRGSSSKARFRDISETIRCLEALFSHVCISVSWACSSAENQCIRKTISLRELRCNRADSLAHAWENQDFAKRHHKKSLAGLPGHILRCHRRGTHLLRLPSFPITGQPDIVRRHINHSQVHQVSELTERVHNRARQAVVVEMPEKHAGGGTGDQG